MNTTHTPGPWQVETEDGSVRVATSDYVIAYVQVLPCIGEDLGNARLIAAAPDLYEALEKLLTVCRNLDQSATHNGLNNCDAMARARAALDSVRY